MNPTVEEASFLLNGSEAWVRSLCKRGLIGDCFCNGTGQRYTYYIVPGRLAEFMRIDEAELMRRLAAMRKRAREWDEFYKNR